MKTIHSMLLRTFIPIFLASILFFILILQLADLFSNLWRYFNNDISILQMGNIALLYIPQCTAYSIPIALLFSISFTLGILYANNELIAILGSGISFYWLISPFIVISLLLSVFNFWFNDSIVIPTVKEKNNLYRELLKINISYNRANATVISDDNRTIYQTEYYDDKKRTLTGVIIIVRADDYSFSKRLDASWAEWNGKNWVLHNCTIYTWDKIKDSVSIMRLLKYSDTGLTKEPDSFRKISRKVDEMNYRDGLKWVETLKKSGLPFREALTNLYKKIAFSLTPLIVALIAGAVGSSFKKNILLMSLLVSLSVSVVYYVMQMVAVIMAKNGYIHPLAGAWGAFIFFLFIGIGLFRFAKT
ncbi:MAG: LptF/LptG family permease [Spirochaetales bacterium]|nr:LptF/LptG family permease [Spirochaetales bacterium]